MAKVIIVGLGPLGIKTVQFAVERTSVEIVGAVDIAPGLAGKDLGEHCGLPRLGVTIAPSMEAALGRRRAECAILTTVSSLAKLEPQVAEAAALGSHGGVGAVCAGLRDGSLSPEDPALLAAIREGAIARLEVDNPRYPTLARLREQPKETK